MPALMTVPLMVFILPTLVTVLIAPAIMSHGRLDGDFVSVTST